MKRILLMLLLITNIAVSGTSVPWTYPSSQVGLVTCTDTRNGHKDKFRTETVEVAEIPAYFFFRDAEGSSHRVRANYIGTVIVCTVELD